MKHAICLLILVMLFPASTFASDENEEAWLQSPDGVVNELYRLICVPKGGPEPDWEKVRTLFIPEAVIVLRVSKEGFSTFTVQGWIDDFVAFNTKAKSSERGFEEKIVRMSPTVFRDIAHILVLYEARMLDWSKPAQPGVDSVELVRKDGRWWIAAITNDLPDEEHPVPAALKD